MALRNQRDLKLLSLSWGRCWLPKNHEQEQPFPTRLMGVGPVAGNRRNVVRRIPIASPSTSMKKAAYPLNHDLRTRARSEMPALKATMNGTDNDTTMSGSDRRGEQDRT